MKARQCRSNEARVFATQGGGGSPMSLRNSAGSVITSLKRLGIIADNFTRGRNQSYRDPSDRIRWRFHSGTSGVRKSGEAHIGPFELCPCRVPSLDEAPNCAKRLLCTRQLHRFERRGFMPQEFETCPVWGATTFLSQLEPPSLLTAAPSVHSERIPNIPRVLACRGFPQVGREVSRGARSTPRGEAEPHVFTCEFSGFSG